MVIMIIFCTFKFDTVHWHSESLSIISCVGASSNRSLFVCVQINRTVSSVLSRNEIICSTAIHLACIHVLLIVNAKGVYYARLNKLWCSLWCTGYRKYFNFQFKHQAMVHVLYQKKYRVLILGGICSCAIFHVNVCNFQW